MNVVVNFRMADGELRQYSGPVGDSLLDVALDNNVPGIVGQCGGGCTCCTCHCYVGMAWFAQTTEPHPDELDMLEYAWQRKSNSRLACQVTLNEALHGIEIEIPAQQS